MCIRRSCIVHDGSIVCVIVEFSLYLFMLPVFMINKTGFARRKYTRTHATPEQGYCRPGPVNLNQKASPSQGEGKHE